MDNKDNNIVVNAKPNTILLQSTAEEVTGGYYDGEGTWHEFGGGGGSSLQPILTVTTTADSSDDAYTPCWEVVDSHTEVYLGDDGSYLSALPKNSTIDFLVPKVTHEGEEPSYLFSTSERILSNSDLVNCTTFEVSGVVYGIVITDPTKPASCTIKVAGGLG